MRRRPAAALRMAWTRTDTHRTVTVLAVGGAAAAITLAVLGLPPVDLHGPLHYLGVMDPLCGGTRAARYTMLGDLGQAWRYNPLGMLAVIAAAGGLTRAAVGVLTRRWLTVAVSWTATRRRGAALVVVAALTALEIRQQLLAELLTSR